MRKSEKLFVIISSVMITFFICFYSYRLIHYRNLELKPNADISVKLYDKILLDNTSSKHLYKDKDTYYFQGNCDNNYITYNGKTFRIISFEENMGIKLILDSSITTLAYGKEFKESYISSWLDNEFYPTLNQEYLTDNITYIDDVDDVTRASKNKSLKGSVGLLSLYEYIKAGAKDSYLNNNEEYWLATTHGDEGWYASEMGTSKAAIASFINKGIRPTITINCANKVINGDGTIDNPYIIENRNVTALKDLYIGETISFGDYNWTVIKKEEEKTKLVMNDVLPDARVFSTSKNTYDIKDKTSIAYYLNNTFINTLEKDYLVEGPFNDGSYGSENYDYKESSTTSVTAYIGLLSIGDAYINTIPNIFLMNKGKTSDNIYTISSSKTIYEDNKNAKKYIRPVIYVDSSAELHFDESGYRLGSEHSEEEQN